MSEGSKHHMHILIIGAGGTALYLAHHLALADHNVVIAGDEATAAAINSSGITILAQNGNTSHTKRITAHPKLDTALHQNQYDWIALCAPAYDTPFIGYQIAEHLPTPTPIVSFQTGIGNEVTLRSILRHDRIVAGTVTTITRQIEAGTFTEHRNGSVCLAADSPASSVITTAFKRTTLDIAQVPDTQSLKWSKLITDLVGNATAAILDLPITEVLRDTRLFDIEWAALREALFLLDYSEVPLVNLPGAPARTLGALTHHLPRQLLRPLLLWHKQRRGHSTPSLRAALQADKRQTEAAWLNGAVVHLAESQERLAPINHALALTVSDIAAGRVPWDMYRHRPEMLITTIRMAQGLEHTP